MQLTFVSLIDWYHLDLRCSHPNYLGIGHQFCTYVRRAPDLMMCPSSFQVHFCKIALMPEGVAHLSNFTCLLLTVQTS